MFKVAIVGLGLIAQSKHIPAFLRLKDKIEIAAVCDLNENIARQVAHRFNIKKIYTNFSEMLFEERPDIVDICTPPQTHTELTLAVIENGAHVLLEKPMALRASDCDMMIEKSSQERRKIFVMHNQIFNLAFIKARERFLKEEIGDFLGINIFLSTPTDYMTSKENHWAHRLPGGVLGETGPHAVYLALAFLKNIYDVDVQARKLLPEYPWSNFEDFRIQIMAENGLAYLTLIYGSNQWAANIDIIGTRGILKIDLESQTIIKYNRPKLNSISVGWSILRENSQVLKSLVLNSLSHILLGQENNPHYMGISKFIDSILEDRPSPVTAEDGKETVRVMEMIVEKLSVKV